MPGGVWENEARTQYRVGPATAGDSRGAVLGFHADPDVLQEQYHWPGNVRELRNLMERAAVMRNASHVDADLVRMLLPGGAAGPPPEIALDSLRLSDAVKDVERRVILRALSATNDNKAEAARLLGICERTLWYKLKRYRL